ncbi:hypothetical protein TrST_g14148 [Triparma strigata]|uniref:PDZ domain-containing protein n=1 Tax=Triparma strigata TaxID=1606541 RepID=A0A9W7AHF8_9STRA|nr:hypothetical protein TrST_g14148 [Triparma strigata]
MSWHRHPVLTSPPSSSSVTLPTVHHTYKPLYGKKEEEELIRATRGQRTAGAGERVVELKRPLGVVLEEDEKGNVYVETVAPLGNAARTGVVKKGDIVVMCSATFGDQLWSTRGCGLPRVLSAIKVRAGPTVTLVLESAEGSAKKGQNNMRAMQAREEARLKAKAKKDKLLEELEEDEKKLKKGLFGLW